MLSSYIHQIIRPIFEQLEYPKLLVYSELMMACLNKKIDWQLKEMVLPLARSTGKPTH